MKKVIIIILFINMLFACSKKEEIEYLENEENYFSSSGTISYIAYTDTNIYFVLDNIEKDFDFNHFLVTQSNKIIIMEKMDDRLLNVGDTIYFTGSKKCLYDGCELYIASLEYNGEKILTFEEGHENLIYDLINKK